jgi:hypothetical protein
MTSNSQYSGSLPSWIFDVDETDDASTDESLAQELEIDSEHIFRTIFFVFNLPYVFARNFHITPKQVFA